MIIFKTLKIMKIITVKIACKTKDAERVEKALNDLQLGVYSFGTTVREPNQNEAIGVAIIIIGAILSIFVIVWFLILFLAFLIAMGYVIELCMSLFILFTIIIYLNLEDI